MFETERTGTEATERQTGRGSMGVLSGRGATLFFTPGVLRSLKGEYPPPAAAMLLPCIASSCSPPATARAMFRAENDDDIVCGGWVDQERW